MLGGDTTQTGTPWRPRLLAIERPLRFPPRTNAPVVLFMSGNFLRSAERRTTVIGGALIMRAGKFQPGHERFADSRAIACRLAGDELHQRAGRIMRADDELHERAETPNGRSAQNVQSREGCFEPVGQPRVSLVTADGTRKLGSEEIVLGNVDAIPGSQENMVEVSLATVIEAHFDALTLRRGGHHRASKVHRHVFEPLHQPSRASRADRSLPEPVLDWPRESPDEVGTRHDLADTCGTNIRRCIEKFRDRGSEAAVNRSRHNSTQPANLVSAGH